MFSLQALKPISNKQLTAAYNAAGAQYDVNVDSRKVIPQRKPKLRRSSLPQVVNRLLRHVEAQSVFEEVSQMQDFLEQEQRKSGKGGAGEGLFGSAIQQSLVTQKVVTSEFMVKKSASTYWALCLTAWSGVVVQLCATEHLHLTNPDLQPGWYNPGIFITIVKAAGLPHYPQSLAVLCPLC
jgi:hypothetical protein